MADEWSVIRNCSSLQEAELLKSVLESEGIESRIPDEHALGVNPGFTNAFGGVRLLVHSNDAQRADEVLGEGE